MVVHNKKMATAASVEAAKENYRTVYRNMRSLPLSEQWTMAPQVKAAKAAAIVEIEEFKMLGGQ